MFKTKGKMYSYIFLFVIYFSVCLCSSMSNYAFIIPLENILKYLFTGLILALNLLNESAALHSSMHDTLAFCADRMQFENVFCVISIYQLRHNFL